MSKKRFVKSIACVMVLALTAGIIAGCGGEKEDKGPVLNVPEGVPTYADDTYIELSAFMGPPGAGYRAYGESFGTHPDDQGFEEPWSDFFTEENFQDYIDAGFTYLLSECNAHYTEPFKGSPLQKYMDLAEKMNIPVVVYSADLGVISRNADPRLSEDTKQIIDNMLEDLSKYTMFKGVTLSDEPTGSASRTFGNIMEYIWSKNPDLYFFNCMLPIYGKTTAFSTGAGEDKQAAYREYVRGMAEATNTFAYDHYPLYIDPVQGVTSVKTDYYLNYELVAQDAKEYGYDMGMIVQSSSWGSYGGEYSSSHPRSTDKSDISFQVYSALAYGAKYITYYTYWEHKLQYPGGYVFDAMVMYPNEVGGEPVKTDIYYAVQAMNEELKKFDHVFLKFDWQGCMAVAAEGKEMSTLLLCVEPYESARIKSVKATNETLIGCMKDENGYDGYFIVNATDPGKDLTDSVTVTFREATSAICYIEGEETTVELQDGSYTFDLKDGQGIFVIPVK